MIMSDYQLPKAEKFADAIVAMNSLPDFKAWVFNDGMQYDSDIQWWDNKKRDSLHEGLDWLLFVQSDETERMLEASSEIPAVLDEIFIFKSSISSCPVSGS